MAAVGLLAGGASAADDVFLKKLVGEWSGNGTMKWDSVSDPERLTCRMSGSLASDGALHESGRCAVSGTSAAVRVEFRANGGGAYSGSASTGLGLRRPAIFAGTGKASQLVVSAVEEEGSTPVTTTIDIVSGGFRLKAIRVDPKTGVKYTAAEVTFGPPQ